MLSQATRIPPLGHEDASTHGFIFHCSLMFRFYSFCVCSFSVCVCVSADVFAAGHLLSEVVAGALDQTVVAF